MPDPTTDRPIPSVVRQRDPHERAEAARRSRVVSSVLAQERARVAGELSDTVLQRLFAVGLDLERATGDAAPAEELLDRARTELAAATQELRTVVRALASGHGLTMPEEVVVRMVEESCVPLGLLPTVTTYGALEDLDDVSTHRLLHALAVLLSTLAHQSDAHAVTVSVGIEEHDLLVRVTDDAGAPSTDRRALLDRLADQSRADGSELTSWPGPAQGTVTQWRCPLAGSGRTLRGRGCA